MLLLTGEFPTNVTPWQRAAEQYGLRLEWLEASLFAGPQGLEALDQQLQRGLSLVALSAVQFQSGLLMPVQEVVRLCHARGAEVCVDVIQAAGVVPLQLAEWDVDYAAGGAHKWLMGCEGAGYLYVSPQAARRWTHRWAGWLSHPEPVDFLMAEGQLRYNKPVRPEVQALEIGTSSGLSQVALEASLDILLALGIESIYNHVQGYLDQLEEPLRQHGWTSLRHGQQRSGSLSLLPPRGTGSARDWAQHLAGQGVRVSHPDGMLRLSPHWWNSLEEVPLVLDAFSSYSGTSRASSI